VGTEEAASDKVTPLQASEVIRHTCAIQIRLLLLLLLSDNNDKLTHYRHGHDMCFYYTF